MNVQVAIQERPDRSKRFSVSSLDNDLLAGRPLVLLKPMRNLDAKVVGDRNAVFEELKCRLTKTASALKGPSTGTDPADSV